MLDAAACGLPVVANDTMTASERLDGNGVRYRLNDQADLARVLLGLHNGRSAERWASVARGEWQNNLAGNPSRGAASGIMKRRCVPIGPGHRNMPRRIQLPSKRNHTSPSMTDKSIEMPAGRREPFRQRASLVAGISGYVALFQWMYESYLYPNWVYFGFQYNAPPTIFLVLAWILSVTPSLWMPMELKRPSQLTY